MSEEKKEEKKEKQNDADQSEAKSERKFLFESLKPMMQRAIEMKLSGYKYKDIAEACQMSQSQINIWFGTGGACKDAYDELADFRTKERIERFKRMDEKFEELAAEAMVVYADALKHNKWKAAESILDRAGFQPVQKTEDLTAPTKAVVIINRPDKQDEIGESKPEPGGGGGDVPVQSDTETG